MQCSGWGHLKDDWAKRGNGKSKTYCHTTKYNDIVFSNYIKDKDTYKQEMQLTLNSKKRSANTFGFVFPEQPLDATEPVLRRMFKRRKIEAAEDQMDTGEEVKQNLKDDSLIQQFIGLHT